MESYYYFTFGTENQIYRGGWIKIAAESLREAEEKFKKHYGEEAVNERGLLRYAFAYTEAEFFEELMATTGNFGTYCREVIK